MGMFDFIFSSTDSRKPNAPDQTPLKNAFRSSFGFGWNAVKAVRNNVVEGVKKHYPDHEKQAKIGRIATKIGHNAVNYACQETLKFIPGRNAFDKIVLQPFRDEMKPRKVQMSRAEKKIQFKGDKIVKVMAIFGVGMALIYLMHHHL